MPKKIDKIGKRFGILTVISEDEPIIYTWPNGKQESRIIYLCDCDCGNKNVKVRSKILSIKNKSVANCGCRKGVMIKKHGECNSNITAEYRAWCAIKRRCYVKTSHAYKDYGERGIKMSDEWFESYEVFLKDMGRKPTPKHSIERVDNEKGYFKENCKWATQIEQCNNKRNNRYITYNSKTLTVAQWYKYLNLNGIVSKNYLFSKLRCSSFDKIMKEIEHKYNIYAK